MPRFHYKARREGGDIIEGDVDVKDRFAVYAHVRKEGATILSVNESGNDVLVWLTKINLITARVKESEKIMLARNLSTMARAGLPVSRALSVMERQTESKKLAQTLKKIREDVVRGTPFHQALKKYTDIFSPLFVSMVRAGEESGRLADALMVVARQMERAYNLKRKIRGALIYPTIIVGAMIVIGILMLVYVVPTLTQTFTELGVELPATTQAVIAVSNFLTDNSLLALLLLGAMGVGLVILSRSATGRRVLDWVFLHIPLISKIVREVNAARTARTLASLLSAGVEVVSSLEITRDVVQNSFYKEVLVEARDAIKRGKPIGEAFAGHEDLYPALMTEMITVGGETGELSAMLEQIADFYESEVEQQTKDLSTVIEPFLMLIIGTVVGFFAISMISPIYSISSGI